MLIPMAFFFPPAMTLGAILRETLVALLGATMAAVWAMFSNMTIAAYNEVTFPTEDPQHDPGNACISCLFLIVGTWFFAYAQGSRSNSRNFSVSGLLVLCLNLGNGATLARRVDYLQTFRYVIPFALGAAVCLVICICLWPETSAGQMLDLIHQSLASIRLNLKQDLEYLSNAFLGLTRDSEPIPFETLQSTQSQLRTLYDVLSRKRTETTYEVTIGKFDPSDLDPILASILHLSQLLGSLMVVLRTLHDLSALDDESFRTNLLNVGDGRASRINGRFPMAHPSISQPTLYQASTPVLDPGKAENMETEYRAFGQFAAPMVQHLGEACDATLLDLTASLMDPKHHPVSTCEELDRAVAIFDSQQRILAQKMREKTGGVLNMLPSEHLYFALSPILELREFAVELRALQGYTQQLADRCRSWKTRFWLPANNWFSNIKVKSVKAFNSTPSPFYATKMSHSNLNQTVQSLQSSDKRAVDPCASVLQGIDEESAGWMSHSSSSNLYLTRGNSVNGIPASPLAVANSQVMRRRASVLPELPLDEFMAIPLESMQPTAAPASPALLSPSLQVSQFVSANQAIPPAPLPASKSNGKADLPNVERMTSLPTRTLSQLSFDSELAANMTWREKWTLAWNDFIFNFYQGIVGHAASFATKMTVAVFVSTVWFYIFPGAWVEFRLFWMVFTVIVTVNPFLGSTNRMGFYRAAGSIVGAFLGAIIWSILPNSIILSSIIFALIAAIGSPTFLYTRYSYSGLITPVTYAVVIFTVTYNPQGNTVWRIALERSLCVVAGVLIALMVMWFMGSGNIARVDIRTSCASIVYQLGLMFSRCVVLYDLGLVVNDAGPEAEAQARDVVLNVCSALERSILRQILNSQANMAVANDEPDLERPWDTQLYSRFLASAQEMSDVITSLKDAALVEENGVLLQFIRKFKRERAEMIGDACVLFHVYSGTLMQKSILPPLLPDPLVSAAQTTKAMRNHPDAPKVFADPNPQAIQYFYGLGGALRRVYRQLHVMQEILEALFGTDKVLQGTFGTWR